MARLEKDLEYAAKKDKTKSSTPQLRYLNHVHAAKLLETGGKVECSSEISGLLQKALIELETLRGSLSELQAKDRELLKREIEKALQMSSKAQDASDVMTKKEAEKIKTEEKKEQDTKEEEEEEKEEDENNLSAPPGCDSKLFDALPSAERRSIKKLFSDARLGREFATLGGDQSKRLIQSITTVLTKDNILKYSGGSLAFEFERLGGQKMKMSWEILVSSVLSSKQYQDLKRLNPFLTPEQTNEITDCVSMALLRTVRIAQTGRALVRIVHRSREKYRFYHSFPQLGG